MKVQAQPHSFSFPKEEEFAEKYTQIYLADQYDKYQESKATYTPADIQSYNSRKQELKEWQTAKLQFMVKVKNGKATPEDFAQQQENDTTIQSITLDEKIGTFIDVDTKVQHSCHQAKIVRSAYISNYNPQDRKILYITGPNSPNIFQNLKTILQADGGIIAHQSYDKIREKDTFEDIIYCASEICGAERDGGKSTWPILSHAEKNEGYTLFFLNFHPLTQHCQNDPELKLARELKQKGKNIMIITSESYGGYRPQKFL